MPTLSEAYSRMVSALDLHFGRPRRLGDDHSPFEKLIACYWERVVSGKQVDSVLAALAESGLSTPDALAGIELAELQDTLRQAGLNASAKALAPLLRVVQWLATHPELSSASADEDDRQGLSTSSLRDELIAIKGIGLATADEILLRVFDRPRYPVDRATYRILLRHGWIDSTADYEEIGDLLIGKSGDDPNQLFDLSVWFEELGSGHCRAGAPRCERCPLEPLLPEGGPRGIEP